MKIQLLCVAVLIATVVQSSEGSCEESGFFNKTKCYLSVAGGKIKDVSISAYDGLADGYDTIKSKITGDPKTTESFDVRSSMISDDAEHGSSSKQNDETTIVFPSSSEAITVDKITNENRNIFQVPTLEANCPEGTRSDKKGRCRVYS